MNIRTILVVLLSLTLFPVAQAQKSKAKITITGKVTDKNNTPVSGALIMIDGKNTSTTTNYKGIYKIRVLPAASQIGVFTTIAGVKEEPINGRTVVDFNLGIVAPRVSDQGTGQNENEVINDGYGTMKKRNASKSVTQTDVSGNQYASYSSIYEVLRTIPGLTVSGNSVTVRGLVTSGSSSPLFVVDGVATSSVSQINPSTIKSIEVLKGPAASVYGLQGGNGVILIHTKGAK